MAVTAPPAVSIVIAFWNAERFIDETIQSILSQTYQNWELLLVDDGSTDRSTQIAQTFAASDTNRIKYLEHAGHTNRGPSASRNLACRAARGKYLLPFDADDVFKSTTSLADQVALLEAHPTAAAIYGPAEYWFSWTGRTHDDLLQDLTVPTDAVVPPPSILIRYLQRNEDQPIKELMRAEVFREVGGYDEQLRQFEDAALSAKVCLRYPVYVSSRCWHRYRQRSDSASALERGRSDWHYLRFIRRLRAFLSEQEWVDADVLNAVRRQSRPWLYVKLRRLLKDQWLRRTDKRIAYWLRTHVRFHVHSALIRLQRMIAGGHRAVSGSIDVDADSLELHPWDRGEGSLTVSWSASGVESVEVRIHSPRGTVFAQAQSGGKSTTGYWVVNPTLFYLQNVSGGTPPSFAGTLAILKVGLKANQRVVTRLCRR